MEVTPFTIGELRLGGKNFFREWLSDLDKTEQKEVDKRLVKVRLGNLGDHRNLSGGIIELRFKNGLRIYCGKDRNKLIVLICGGDKASGKRAQNADIKLAKGLWAQYTKERNKK